MAKRKYAHISTHQTLHGELNVNWEDEYNNEFKCPNCNIGDFTTFRNSKGSTCKIQLVCNHCKTPNGNKKQISLTCQIKAHISRYRFDKECPNPLCTQIGKHGQKGWIYEIGGDTSDARCYFCGIGFKYDSSYKNSWYSNQIEDTITPYNFQDDLWDLRIFFDKPYQKLLVFQEIQPHWYKNKVKEYLSYLLKSKRFTSDSQIRSIIVCLRQFGKIIAEFNIKSELDINRNNILAFLEVFRNNKSNTVNRKLAHLRDFFDYLNLEDCLVRNRDFLKTTKNDPDWLDAVSRRAIKENLDKIPAPIARHYIVQSYIAARSEDSCQLPFDCLVEENTKWYVKFFQDKTKRWHRILASRKIRRVIEEQQQWIRETIDQDYSYLFCDFRGLRQESYPDFPGMKPLPRPPYEDADKNEMVRIIRMLIEKENILDANGQKPHFTNRITRSTRIQEVRAKYGMEAARLYADHKSSETTFQHYAPPTREQIAEVDLPFQKLLLNPDNRFLPWQSLPESLLKNPTAHELDLEIAPRLVVYGHCTLDPKTPCPVNLFPKCYGCSSFRPSTSKLFLYERQYEGEQQRLTEAETAGAELASEEAKATITAMDKWLPELRRLANG